MGDLRFVCLCLLLASTVHVCLTDESEEAGDSAKKFLDGTVGQSMKGFGDFFKNVADNVQEKSEDGMDLLKTFTEGAKEKSEEVGESMKGFADGLGERFSSVKEKLSETGEKMKESLSDAAVKSKQQFETAASDISKHAMGAGDAVMKLFG